MSEDVTKNVYIIWDLLPQVWKTEVEELIRIFFSKIPNIESGTYLVLKYHGYNTIAERQLYRFLIFTIYSNEVIPIFHEPARAYQASVWEATYFIRRNSILIYSEPYPGYPELTNIAIYKIA
jgi:hypothetical protein